jgi:hypothetical protein
MLEMDFMFNKPPSISNRDNFMSIEQDFSQRFPSLLEETPDDPLSYFVPTVPAVTEIDDLLVKRPVDIPRSIFEDRNQIPTFNMDDFLIRNNLYQTPEDRVMQDQNKLNDMIDFMDYNNQANLFDSSNLSGSLMNPNYSSGQNYAQSIAGGENVANMIAPGVAYSSDNPQGFTQQDINTGVVPNPFEYTPFAGLRGPSLPKMQNPPKRADQLFIDDGPGSLGRENELLTSNYSPLNLAGIQRVLDNLG